MALRVPEGEVLRQALRSKHDETFEKSLGRAVRDAGGTYEDYIALISRVREAATAEKVDLREAARKLSGQA